MKSIEELVTSEPEGRCPGVIVVDTVLLGHLGDLCMMVRLSRANPARIRLFTQPQYVDFARGFGAFVQVSAFTQMPTASSTFIDLHTTSCQIDSYKQTVLSSGRAVQATPARLKWLGVKGRSIHPRRYGTEPIADYWVRVLGLPRTIEHLPSSEPVSARCLHGWSDCLTLVALQSSTRHKSLGGEATRELVSSMSRLTRGRAVLVEGPGRSALDAQTTPRDLRVLRIGSPHDLLRVAESACCMVSVDSGLRHVASLAQLPRIILYGPTTPDICGSGDGEVPIPSSASCHACGNPHVCVASDKYSCLSAPQTVVRSVEYQWSKLHQVG